jgi:hypothetical protein
MATKKTATIKDVELHRKLQREAARETRIRQSVPSKGTSFMVPMRKVNGKTLTPNVTGILDRSQKAKPYVSKILDAAKVVNPDDVKAKMAQATDYIGTYYGVNGIRPPEYDMLEPFVLVDTEAYLKQAIDRKLSLMFRSGFEVTGKQQRLADYIKKRLQTIAYVTSRTTTDLFSAIMFNLSLCSNCFVLKIRDEKGSTGVKSERNSNKIPVAGYSIIPAHMIFPFLEKGVITKWRRYYETGRPFEDVPIEDVIHFKWDVKPGHIYGTPRTVGVRDDIFALRRLEENVELLFINHLFPLMHVKIGTPEKPCDYFEDGTSEIDYVRAQIENMPKEGVFVTDDRVEVNNVGSEGESLKFVDFVAHLKSRVYTGLGVSAVDMGEGDTANRATADNISQVLKDSIKKDQNTFSGLVSMHMFKEFFQESTHSLSIQGAVAETQLEWHEVDTDGQIKLENHANNLYNSHLVGRNEARSMMKRKPMVKGDEQDKNTHYELQVKDLETHKANLARKAAKDDVDNQKALAETQIKVMKAGAEAEHSKAEAHKKKAHSQIAVLKAKTAHAQATGGKTGTKKTTPTKKSAQNKNTPTNQHGSNTGPTKAKSARETVIGLIHDELTFALEQWDGRDETWPALSADAIDLALVRVEGEIGADEENSYTRQVRKESDRLKNSVANTTDPDLLYVLLTTELEDTPDDDVETDPVSASNSESEFVDPADDPDQDPEPTGGNSDA